MKNTICLCKTSLKNRGIKYVYLHNTTPKEHQKGYMKTLKWLKKNNFDSDYYEVKEFLGYQSKDFDLVLVSIEVSKAIREIRNVIENKKYYYNDIQTLKDGPVKMSHLFDLGNLSSIDEKEDSIVYNRVKKFLDSTDDVYILKRTIGKYLFWFYLYDAKQKKYFDIIEKIKSDFENYYKKDKFFIWKRDKEHYRNTYLSVGLKTDIKLDQIKSDRYLNINSYKLGNLDTLWLKTRLQIDVDKKRLTDECYIEELKKTYNSKDKPLHQTDYEDFTVQSYETVGMTASYNGHYGDGDEVILLSKDQKIAFEKNKKDYYDNLIKEYGSDVTEQFINVSHDLVDLGDDDSYILRIVKKGNKIVFKEIISDQNLPKWFDRFELDGITHKEADSLVVAK